MTTTQQIFLVFFAIFWGAIFNVQGRWKMFQPVLLFPYIWCRLLLSILVVNVGPIIFFVGAFFCLRTTPTSPSDWGIWETIRQLLSGVLPAFAIFGFYRLWLGVVELVPTIFYKRRAEQEPRLAKVDPTIEELGLGDVYKGWNLLFAIGYFGVAIVGLWLQQF